jgi:hypothetical protein
VAENIVLSSVYARSSLSSWPITCSPFPDSISSRDAAAAAAYLCGVSVSALSVKLRTGMGAFSATH